MTNIGPCGNVFVFLIFIYGQRIFIQTHVFLFDLNIRIVILVHTNQLHYQ